MGFVSAAYGDLLNAGVNFIQAKATWDMADYQKQEDMPIEDWCAQYRECKSIAGYTA